MSSSSEPVPFEVHEAGGYLHGTKADLAVDCVGFPGNRLSVTLGSSSNPPVGSTT